MTATDTRPSLELLVNDQPEDEVVHTWCQVCATADPMLSVCGIDLTGHGYMPVGGVKCERCSELWPVHSKTLHS